MGGLLDYFSREEGLKRREKLDSAIAEAARYYLGPTGLPERLGLIAEANPVQGVMRSMQAGREVMSPTATPMERVGATGRMLSEVAAAAAPSVAAYKGAIPAAQAVQEGLLGVSAGSKLATKNFIADESGSVPLGRIDPVVKRGDEVLSLLARGRGAEVTDAMLDLGDPVSNTRLNQYLFDNYDLPMDQASRMARASEMGFEGIGYHGTPKDFTAFDVSAPANTGVESRAVWSSDSPQVAETYGGKIIPAMGRQGWPADIDFSGRSTAYFDNLTRTPSNLANYLQDVRDDALTYGVEEGSDLAFDLHSVGVDPMYADEIGGVIMRDVNDSMDVFGGDISTNYATFDPANIRSRFARFDPRLSHLKNLSAGIGGVSVFGLLDGNGVEGERRRENSGLLD